MILMMMVVVFFSFFLVSSCGELIRACSLVLLLALCRQRQQVEQVESTKLSIVVLDVDHERPLLFPDAKKIISLPDHNLIVGIRNRRNTAQKRHVCNGQAAGLNLNAISRELFAHVLAALWGVGDVSTSMWNQAKERFDASLLWSTGSSLFGPFAVEPAKDSDGFSSVEFPFYQVHAHLSVCLYTRILRDRLGPWLLFFGAPG